MNFVIGLILLFLLLTAIKQFARLDAAAAARIVRHGGGVIGMIGALLLLLRGRVSLAAAVAGMVASFAGWRTPGAGSSPFRDAGRGARPGRASLGALGDDRDAARSRHRRDRRQGARRVLRGQGAGNPLAAGAHQSSPGARSATIPEGVNLLEAYLDRRFAGWREADQGECSGAGEGAAPAGRCRARRRSKSWVCRRRGRGRNHPRPSDLDEKVSSRSWRLDRACRAGQSGQGCSDAATRLDRAPERRTASKDCQSWAGKQANPLRLRERQADSADAESRPANRAR